MIAMQNKLCYNFSVAIEDMPDENMQKKIMYCIFQIYTERDDQDEEIRILPV